MADKKEDKKDSKKKIRWFWLPKIPGRLIRIAIAFLLIGLGIWFMLEVFPEVKQYLPTPAVTKQPAPTPTPVIIVLPNEEERSQDTVDALKSFNGIQVMMFLLALSVLAGIVLAVFVIARIRLVRFVIAYIVDFFLMAVSQDIHFHFSVPLKIPARTRLTTTQSVPVAQVVPAPQPVTPSSTRNTSLAQPPEKPRDIGTLKQHFLAIARNRPQNLRTEKWWENLLKEEGIFDPTLQKALLDYITVKKYGLKEKKTSAPPSPPTPPAAAPQAVTVPHAPAQAASTTPAPAATNGKNGGGAPPTTPAAKTTTTVIADGANPPDEIIWWRDKLRELLELAGKDSAGTTHGRITTGALNKVFEGEADDIRAILSWLKVNSHIQPEPGRDGIFILTKGPQAIQRSQMDGNAVPFLKVVNAGKN